MKAFPLTALIPSGTRIGKSGPVPTPAISNPVKNLIPLKGLERKNAISLYDKMIVARPHHPYQSDYEEAETDKYPKPTTELVTRRRLFMRLEADPSSFTVLQRFNQVVDSVRDWEDRGKAVYVLDNVYSYNTVSWNDLYLYEGKVWDPDPLVSHYAKFMLAKLAFENPEQDLSIVVRALLEDIQKYIDKGQAYYEARAASSVAAIKSMFKTSGISYEDNASIQTIREGLRSLFRFEHYIDPQESFRGDVINVLNRLY